MLFWNLVQRVRYVARMIAAAVRGVSLSFPVAIGPNCTIQGEIKIRLGPRVWIGANAVFQGKGSVTVGADTYIGAGFSCNCVDRVSIGNDCMLGNGVSVIDNDHGMQPGVLMRQQRLRARAVEIGDNCWIGERAVILSGVQIGSGAVVAAGAVVRRDVDPDAVVAGVPARLIRRRGEAAADR